MLSHILDRRTYRIDAMRIQPQAAPDNERIFDILAGADANYRKMLTEMIEAKATPHTLSMVISSWEMLRSSIAEESRPLNLNGLRGRAVGAAVAGADMAAVIGGMPPGNYIPTGSYRRRSDAEDEMRRQLKEECDAVTSKSEKLGDVPCSTVWWSSTDTEKRESIYTEEEPDAMD